ncbi:MAG: alpha/beta hydrolase family esterase [Lachnospiraceae bacterium]
MVKNRILQKADPQNPYRPFFVGTYTFTYEVGDKIQKMMMYIPENTKASTSGVYLFPPDGVTAEEFLKNSNWMELADTEEHREKLVLFVFEAADGGSWNLNEAYQAQGGDQEYLWEAFLTSMKREFCCVYEGKRYLVGYREGGAVATRFAMNDPADIAGIVTVDAPPVSVEYIKKAGTDLCTRLHNYVDASCVQGIVKGDIPMHAWFISAEAVDALPEVQYWRRANQDEAVPRMIEMDTWEYYRTKELQYPLDEEKAGYTVWVTKTQDTSEKYGNHINRSIWKKFLYQVIRWAANPGGSLRIAKDPVHDLGMEYYYEAIDGWMREWYVYIPQKVRKNPNLKVPLVFVSHGYSCTGELSIGNTNWDHIAEQYGFIAVFPSALYGNIKGDGNALDGAISSSNCPLPAWNLFDEAERPLEINFFMHMLEDVCRRYSIDRSRVYATGTSMGNLMTQYLALKRPDLFAAVAPTSGILHMADGEKMLDLSEVKTRPDVCIPIWMFGGEMEDFLLDAVPATDNRTGETIRVWWKLNQMPSEIPEDFSGISQKVKGRWNDWIFEKDGIPMIRFTGIDYYPHSVNPEMSYRIWEEFFSKIRRGEDGTSIYEG